MDFLFKLYKDSHSEESKAYSEWAVNHSPYLSVVKNKIEDIRAKLKSIELGGEELGAEN